MLSVVYVVRCIDMFRAKRGKNFFRVTFFLCGLTPSFCLPFPIWLFTCSNGSVHFVSWAFNVTHWLLPHIHSNFYICPHENENNCCQYNENCTHLGHGHGLDSTHSFLLARMLTQIMHNSSNDFSFAPRRYIHTHRHTLNMTSRSPSFSTSCQSIMKLLDGKWKVNRLIVYSFFHVKI